MFLKKRNLIIIFFLIIIMSNISIYACDISIDDFLIEQYNIEEDNSLKLITLSLNVSSFSNKNLIVQKEGESCDDYTVLLEINNDLDIQIEDDKDKFDFILSGIDKIIFSNDANLSIFYIVKEYANNNPDFLYNELKIDSNIFFSNSTKSNIKIIQKIPNKNNSAEYNNTEDEDSDDEDSEEDNEDSTTNETVKFNLDKNIMVNPLKFITNNVIIDENSSLNFLFESENQKKYEKGDRGEKNGIDGASFSFDVNSIVNNGYLNLNIKAGNGQGGAQRKTGKKKTGSVGGKGGSLFFKLNYLEVLEDSINTILHLNSGNGGSGGKGSNERSVLGGCAGHGGEGGEGADGGLLNFELKYIHNKAPLEINLNSGNGGKGGKVGDNYCSPKDFTKRGGYGGFGGNILLSKINNLFILDSFIFNLKAGDGGALARDGTKAKKEFSLPGVGGSFLDNLIIENFYNESSDVKINMISGNKGEGVKREPTSETISSYTVDFNSYGYPGSTSDIIINYLENKNVGIEIINKVDQDITDVDNKYIRTGSFRLNYLETGSYLPKKIQLFSQYHDDLFDLPSIDITGCYVKESGENKLEYLAKKKFNIKIANFYDIYNDFFNIKKIAINFNKEDNDNCPFCDALKINETEGRFDDTYTIYSNQNGIIEEGDLKIYYSTDGLDKYRPPYLGEDEEYVIYINNTDINAVYSEKFSTSEEPIYEYVLSKEKLFSPKEGETLDGIYNSRTYCFAQNYIIEGSIILDNRDYKYFEIPFMPVFNIK